MRFLQHDVPYLLVNFRFSLNNLSFRSLILWAPAGEPSMAERKGISPSFNLPKSPKLVPFKTPTCKCEPVPGPKMSKRICTLKCWLNYPTMSWWSQICLLWVSYLRSSLLIHSVIHMRPPGVLSWRGMDLRATPEAAPLVRLLWGLKF